MLTNVTLKIRLCLQAAAANGAVEELRQIVVCSTVSIQSGFLRERFLAEITLEGGFAAFVDVHLQTGLVGECLIAIGAREGLARRCLLNILFDRKLLIFIVFVLSQLSVSEIESQLAPVR